MRYLVTSKFHSPFFTDWFDCTNHFNVELGMIVYDLVRFCFTLDGKEWEPIEIDHL
ncbi:MAG: hypothetical protein ACTHNG_03360 [Ginsengibacter sp.]